MGAAVPRVWLIYTAAAVLSPGFLWSLPVHFYFCFYSVAIVLTSAPFGIQSLLLCLTSPGGLFSGVWSLLI